MTERPTTLRVVIALESGHDAESALQAALSFAAGAEAEFLGLFVEDINLLRVAELPAAGEVMFSTGAFRRVERGELEKQIRTQAREIRRRFESGARDRRVSFEFESMRGEPVTEVTRAAEGADLLIVTRTRSGGGPLASGNTSLEALTRDTRRPVIFVQPAWNTGRRVMTVADDIGDALAVAERIAQREGLELLVAAAPGADIDTLCRNVRLEDVRALVLPRELPGLDVGAVRHLLDSCRASLILV